jgi:hypothetical protein
MLVVRRLQLVRQPKPSIPSKMPGPFGKGVPMKKTKEGKLCGYEDLRTTKGPGTYKWD